MTEVPKIVHDRLRAGLPGQAASGTAHPDADLLTAFAEQALSGAERDNMLDHLALCGACREVVAMALPPEAVAVPGTTYVDQAAANTAGNAKRPERSRLAMFAWPTLRWAALAAGVALAASVLLLRSDKQKVATLSPLNPAAVSTAPTAPIPPTAPSMDHVATFARADVAKSKPALSLSKKLKAEQGVPRPVQTESGILMADNKDNKKDSGLADKPSAGVAAGTRSFAYDAPTSRKTTEQVEVSSAAVAAEATPSADGNLMAQNEVPAIEKAKPAPHGLEVDQEQKIQAASAPAMARASVMSGASALKLESAKQALPGNVTWTINQGVLKRSTDSGQSWQNAVRADHPLLCYASHNEDVWTGGQAGALFHSADGGLTWAQVQPSIKAQPLNADITHIDVRGPAEIVVSSSNNETWSTVDAGKTWEKK